jgi:hypothetical protein
MRNLILPLAFAASCGTPQQDTPQPATTANEKCPKVSMDDMEGKWIRVEGSKGDHTTRLQLVPTENGLDMWFTGGFFTKTLLKGERRKRDYKFTEVPNARKKAAFVGGSESLLRLYLEPRIKTCSLRMSTLEVYKKKDGKESERPRPGFTEYLPFPEGQEFTFRPCDGDLFLGSAAKNRATAKAQLAATGAPDPVFQLGEKIPVGTWTDATAEGDAACTFDMDLYFDDRPVRGRQGIPAGDVKAGERQWFVPDWYAPFSGNRHFQIYRYRSCGVAARELIGVSCLEAVLVP